jgi:ParB-like chromosome segregation protein Spo0J
MASLINHPRIEMMRRTNLRADPKHPRKHHKKQLEKLARAMSRFGFLVPVIVDDTGLIVAGLGRWLAAALLGLDEIPVIRVSFLTDEDRRAFALADNRMSELSEWDEDLLREQLEHLFEHDYDLTLTGFELADLDLGVPMSAEEEA